MADKMETQNRRQFLVAGTTVGLTLLAGCGSGSDSDTNNSTETTTPAITTHSGPADFHARLTGPSNVTLGEPFRLTLNARNIGGETDMLSTHIRVSEGRSTLNRALEQSINPGESVKMQTDPIRFDAADDYTFSVGFSKAVTHTVTVQPKTAGFGKTFDLSDTLKATVKSIDFHPALLYSPPQNERTFLDQPSSNNLLAVVHVDLENTGSDSAALDGEFELEDAETRQALGTSSPLAAAKIDGAPLSDLQLSAGQQQTGWLLGELSRSKARKAVTVVYQRDTADTPPEIKWTNTPKQGTRDLPQFAVEDFQLPNTTTQGESATANITLSNKGNASGTFQGVIQSRGEQDDDWRPVQPLTATIRANESAQQNLTINSSSNGTVSYRLAPLNQTQSIEYIPPTVGFGESYTSTENVEITVENPQTAKSVKVDTGLGTDRITPPTGKRFVLAQVHAVTVGDSEGTPFSSEFLLNNGSQMIPQADDVTQTLLEPVEGESGGGVYDPDKGESFSWYCVWPVSQQVSVSDLSVIWKSGKDSSGAGDETARWTNRSTEQPS